MFSTFTSALDTCKSSGTNLVQILSSDENKFVADLTTARTNLWIGFNDIDKHGKWVWIATGEVGNGNYTNWHPGQPDEKAHCAVMRRSLHEGTWDDQPCHNKEWFVCQRGEASFPFRSKLSQQTQTYVTSNDFFINVTASEIVAPNRQNKMITVSGTDWSEGLRN